MAKNKKPQYAATTLLVLIAAQVLWGVNTPIIKLGLKTVPLPLFLSVTILGAALLILPLAQRSWKKLSAADYWLIVIASLIGITLGNVVLLMGLERIPSVNVSIIKLFSPLLLFILSVRFLKEQLNLRTFGGILVAFAGAAVLIGQPWQSGHQNEGVGALLIILSVMCDVIATLIMKPVLSRSSSPQITFIHLSVGILPIAVYSLSYLPDLDYKAVEKQGLIAIIVNILFITAANIFFMFGLKYRKAQEIGIFQYVSPVATFIAAWFILSEKPDTSLLIGAPLIFLGIYLAIRKSAPARLSR
jgi:drug/metabolite transporter (DMT)-like permease